MASLCNTDSFGRRAAPLYKPPLFTSAAAISSPPHSPTSHHSSRSECSSSPASSISSSSTICPPSNLKVKAPSSSVLPPLTNTAISRVFSTLLKGHRHASATSNLRPIIVRNVTPPLWDLFRKKYAEFPAFQKTKWEYDDVRRKVIAVPLPEPFHDFAVKVMTDHVKLGMSDARLDTRPRIQSLRIDRENLFKRTSDGVRNQREPDCATWTSSYEGGVIPTIVWEVGHSQKRSSLLRRAKMWCRRYDGKVTVVILVKYLRRDPRVDNASVLMAYRPARRADGKWTAVQDGPTYVLFPRPQGAAKGVYNSPADAVPLTYEDYFGPGNVGGPDPGTGQPINPKRRFDLPLECVREMIEEVVAVTIRRDAYRYVSGGSSTHGAVATEDNTGEGDGKQKEEQVEMEYEGEDEEEERDSPVEEEFHAFHEDWDAAMSDVSDD